MSFFDENGKYIPRKQRVPEVTLPTKESERKKSNRRKEPTHGISNPSWTKLDPKWKKLLEEELKPRNGGVKAFPEGRASILEHIKESVEEKGFYQISYGPEFIRSSYALAKETEDLFRKEVNNWDCSTGEFFFDPNLKLFWRYTGSFD